MLEAGDKAPDFSLLDDEGKTRTLDEFRGQYAYNLLDDAYKRFAAEVAQVNQRDDHEVHYTVAHRYDPARAAIQDFTSFWEFVSGPAHAGPSGRTRGRHVRAAGGVRERSGRRGTAPAHRDRRIHQAAVDGGRVGGNAGEAGAGRVIKTLVCDEPVRLR